MVIRKLVDELSLSIEYQLAYFYDLMDISALYISKSFLKNFFIGKS